MEALPNVAQMLSPKLVEDAAALDEVVVTLSELASVVADATPVKEPLAVPLSLIAALELGLDAAGLCAAEDKATLFVVEATIGAVELRLGGAVDASAKAE
jgi:hypothetical protein